MYKTGKEYNDSNNSNKTRFLELSTNVNDYDTGEPLNFSNNDISETGRGKKIDRYKSVLVKTGDKFRP
jgi:hypothetical protein